jgi:hypothetical protein
MMLHAGQHTAPKGTILFEVGDFILIIEDEHGALVYSSGDLSFLMSEDAVITEEFAAQLDPAYQDE